MPSGPLEVIVIGGGIGGLCLAQGLLPSGANVRVYERGRSSDDWVRGYRIHVNQMGARSLHQCLPRPLWEAFTATSGHPGPGFGFHTHHLERLVFVEESVMTGDTASAADAQYATSRSTLHTLLAAGLNDVIQYGKTFERYESRSDGRVTAFFADGTHTTGDVLVGADGAGSRVRRQYLPHARRVDTDALAIGGRLPLDESTRAWLPAGFADGLNLVLPPRDSALFTATFNGERRMRRAIDEGPDLDGFGVDLTALAGDVHDYLLLAFIAHRRIHPPDVAGLDGAGLKHLMGTLTRDWDPILRRVIAEADPDSMRLMPFRTSVPVPPWPATTVTLLGDAIHSMTPAMGFGANVALRDAALLSSKLSANRRGEVDLLTAIGGYERQMLDHGFRAVRTARRLTNFMISGNTGVRSAAKIWFRLCHGAPRLKRLSFGGSWTDTTPQEPGRRPAAHGGPAASK